MSDLRLKPYEVCIYRTFFTEFLVLKHCFNEEKIAYNTDCMQVLYANFYGGIQVQKRQKYHLKMGVNAHEYWVNSKG